MTAFSPHPTFLYTFNYDLHNAELCTLEIRQLFDATAINKTLFSSVDIDPSCSPFIKHRIQVTSFSEDYTTFLSMIQKEDITIDGLKIEYVLLHGDERVAAERHKTLKDVGYQMRGYSDVKVDHASFAIGFYQNVWYFGVFKKHDHGWHKHKKKPRTFSSSINMDIAKTLVSIASKGNKSVELLDACCGVGTVLLEACFAGFNLEGCDINWKACNSSRENLKFFDYSTNVFCSDIKDLSKTYDGAIIDLPYNLYTYSNDEIVLNIIQSAALLAPRLVIVSMSDIGSFITESGLQLIDYCTVGKRGSSTFKRQIWVCERCC